MQCNSAAREHRFEQVAGHPSILRFAGADYGVEFVDEEDDAAGGILHFFEDRLEALFKFASILGPGDPARPYPAEMIRLSLDPLGTSPRTDSLR